MHRIDHTTAAVALPTPDAVGTPGYFVKGSPGTATPATIVTADWANAVQEELANVIEEAGDTLDKGDHTQLKVAIDAMIAAAVAGVYPLPPKHISGCQISNNATDAVYDIDIAVGKAKSSDDTYDIAVTAAIGKRLDAVWATAGTPGTTTGGRASGVALAAGWYRVFLISKTDGTVNAGFDTSDTAVNLLVDATGYTKYRHVGWIYYSGSTIVKFYQTGARFEFDTPVADYSAATLASTTESKTLTVPKNTIADLSVICRRGYSSGSTFWRFYRTDMTSAAASSSNADFTSGVSGGGTWEYSASGMVSVVADSSSQIKLSCSTTGADSSYYINTLGWVDPDLL